MRRFFEISGEIRKKFGVNGLALFRLDVLGLIREELRAERCQGWPAPPGRSVEFFAELSQRFVPVWIGWTNKVCIRFFSGLKRRGRGIPVNV